MKLDIRRNCITLHPETDLEEAFLADTMGLEDGHTVLRVISRGGDSNGHRNYTIGPAEPSPHAYSESPGRVMNRKAG